MLGKGAKIAQGQGTLIDFTQGIYLGSGAVESKVSGKGNTVNITTTDPAVLQSIDALGTNQSETLTNFLRDASRSSSEAADSTNSFLDKVLGKVGDLAENKQTGGESGQSRTVLYVVLAIVLGVVVYFWPKK